MNFKKLPSELSQCFRIYFGKLNPANWFLDERDKYSLERVYPCISNYNPESAKCAVCRAVIPCQDAWRWS